MGHYDNCRDGYCAGCGAAPGNLAANGGKCPFCEKKKKPKGAVTIPLGDPSGRQHSTTVVRHSTPAVGESWVGKKLVTHLYYLQDSRSYTGNCVMWWAKGGGYTSDVSRAEVFTEEKAKAQEAARESDRPWPKGYIDGLAKPRVDMQYMRKKGAETFLKAPPQPSYEREAELTDALRHLVHNIRALNKRLNLGLALEGAERILAKGDRT